MKGDRRWAIAVMQGEAQSSAWLHISGTLTASDLCTGFLFLGVPQPPDCNFCNSEAHRGFCLYLRTQLRHRQPKNPLRFQFYKTERWPVRSDFSWMLGLPSCPPSLLHKLVCAWSSACGDSHGTGVLHMKGTVGLQTAGKLLKIYIKFEYIC